MCGSGWEALTNVRKWSGAFLDVREWSLGSPGCPGVVGRPSVMPGSGRDALPVVGECSGGFPGCPGVVVRISRMSGSVRDALLDVPKWS